MTLPVRSLPVIQNWDCQSCANCCRDYEVSVTEEERQRILAQGWENDDALRGVKLFQRHGWFSSQYSLAHRPNDAGCVFLDEKGSCRIHAKFGASAKPLACRIYPFILVPNSDHWRVGLRYACPSAAGNEGKSAAAHQPEIRTYAGDLEKRSGMADGLIAPVPQLKSGTSVPLSDLLLFVEKFLAIVAATNEPLEFRLRKCLALVNLCRDLKFENVTGEALHEFLEIMSAEVAADTPSKGKVPAPGWIGRLLFRQSLAVFARKDSGPNRGISQRGRLALFWAAWRFASGSGKIPRVHEKMSEMTFEDLELPSALAGSGDELLMRYFVVKIDSMQFCGPSNFGRSFFDGFESLVLTYPSILWLARNFSRSMPHEQALTLAVQVVDDNFGFNPWLGSSRQLFATRTLARRSEIARLVAWYSR